MGLVRSYVQFKLGVAAAAVLVVAAGFVGSLLGASGTWAVVVGGFVVSLAVFVALAGWRATR